MSILTKTRRSRDLAGPLFILFTLAAPSVAGCARGCSSSSPAPAKIFDAATDVASAADPVSLPQDAASSSRACRAVPLGGLVVVAKNGVTDVRIAATKSSALVTWLEESWNESGGRRAGGRLFRDGATPALDDARVVEQTEYADEPLAGAVPLLFGAALGSVACVNEAPTATFGCGRTLADGSTKSLFVFPFDGMGLQEEGIAGVAKPDGSSFVVFVPNGKSVLALTSTTGKQRRHFVDDEDPSAFAKKLAAAATGPSEVTVVFRTRSEIHARQSDFAGAWLAAGDVVLSTPGTEVGAPAVTRVGGAAFALYPERARASDPWRLASAVVENGAVRRGNFVTGSEPADAPALTTDRNDACFVVAWVEGRDAGAMTRVGRACSGELLPASVATLSRAATPSGSAALARSDGALFAAWQEFPKGSPAEVRVARLDCDDANP